MVDYYLEQAQSESGLVERIWAFDGTTAHQDIFPSTLGTHHADSDADILTTVKRRFPGSQFHALNLKPGEYYPRMARPSGTKRKQSPGSNPDNSAAALKVKTISTGQLYAMIQELQKICRVVHPDKTNFKTYGHEIRNLLIIACTEVEVHWKNILKANHSRAENRLDYVKLSSAMKLREYRVTLPWYPWLDPIAPFENWVSTPAGVQQNLPWYNAYNAVKHDRENNFHEATLEYLMQSLSGCFVMLCAQYGWAFARQDGQLGDAFFQLVDYPCWGPSDIYIEGNPLRERDFSFAP